MTPALAATFQTLDIVVIVIYLGAMAALGAWFAKRNNSTEQYFLGSRAFPGWAIGLSMLGTSISSFTFLAFPAAAFILDWRLVVPNLMLPFVAVLAILFFIPLFRRGRTTSAFEYLEARYGPLMRLYGALTFLLLQLIRLGMVLFLVALPVQALLGVPITWVIVLGGIFILIYTVAGGIEAVIWTDVIQTVILLGGGLMCVVLVVVELPGGLGQVFSEGAAAGKFGVGPVEWDLGQRTVFTMMLVGLFSWINEYSSNQNVVQRYLSASSTREARKATGICALMSVPTWALFFFVGTALFVYYQANPDPAIAGMDSDQVFPHFIVTQLPVGLTGLIIAAVLAAAMSSLDSSINAVSTVTVIDLFKRRLTPDRDDRFYLRVARWVALAAGGLMIGGALLFHQLPKESMVDLGLIVGAVSAGCLAGLFILGFFTRRVDYFSVGVATIVALVVNLYFVFEVLDLLPTWAASGIHAYWVGLLVNIVFVIVAYGVSLFRNGPTTDLTGLTVWTLPGRSAQTYPPDNPSIANTAITEKSP
jgi:SSS family solute:Na+ symporter